MAVSARHTWFSSLGKGSTLMLLSIMSERLRRIAREQLTRDGKPEKKNNVRRKGEGSGAHKWTASLS
eukprot:2320326-Amphidinium_carterae.2